MVILIECENRHRFPVNPAKHVNRDYRICPHRDCGAVVRKKGMFKKSFAPNPDQTWRTGSRAKHKGDKGMLMSPGILEAYAGGFRTAGIAMASLAKLMMGAKKKGEET